MDLPRLLIVGAPRRTQQNQQTSVTEPRDIPEGMQRNPKASIGSLSQDSIHQRNQVMLLPKGKCKPLKPEPAPDSDLVFCEMGGNWFLIDCQQLHQERSEAWMCVARRGAIYPDGHLFKERCHPIW